MVAIAEQCASGALPAVVSVVISDVENAGILSRARGMALPAVYIAPGPYRTKLDESAEQEYVRVLKEANVEWIVLAGFMRIIKSEFLEQFWGKVVNIHPSLLPSFPGLEAWRQALDYGVKFTGCTVHIVDHGIDTGPILGQEIVPVLDSDTPKTLHSRIQEAERRLYPAVLRELAMDQIGIQGRRSHRK